MLCDVFIDIFECTFNQSGAFKGHAKEKGRKGRAKRVIFRCFVAKEKNALFLLSIRGGFLRGKKTLHQRSWSFSADHCAYRKKKSPPQALQEAVKHKSLRIQV
jgi:hypothetical protein